MSRPALLLALALLGLIVAACGGGGDDDAPTPEPSSPRDAAERWLKLWKDRRYSDMYDLVSPDVQATIDRETFVGRYEAITEEARLTSMHQRQVGDGSRLPGRVPLRLLRGLP